MSTGSSCGLPVSNLKVHTIHVAPLIPLETYYLLLNVQSKSQIVRGKICNKRLCAHPAAEKCIRTKDNYVRKHNWQDTMIYEKNCHRVMIHIREVTNTNLSGVVNVYSCVSSVVETQPPPEPALLWRPAVQSQKKNPTLHDKPCAYDNHATYVHLKKLRLWIPLVSLNVVTCTEAESIKLKKIHCRL